MSYVGYGDKKIYKFYRFAVAKNCLSLKTERQTGNPNVFFAGFTAMCFFYNGYVFFL